MQFTEQHRANLKQYLSTHKFPSSGLGPVAYDPKEYIGSLAAINLAIDGTISDKTPDYISEIFIDKIPDCMSEILGQVMPRFDLGTPNEMLNSAEYKALLPDMAGTGREHEEERLDILLDWMWGTVLPQVQPLADRGGFGEKWQTMCQERTKEAASVATKEAVLAYRAAREANTPNHGAGKIYEAYKAFDRVQNVAAWARNAARATEAAVAAAAVAESAAHAGHSLSWARLKRYDNFWKTVDPIALLKRMTYLETEQEQNMTV